MSILLAIPKAAEVNADHIAKIVSPLWILSFQEWETWDHRMVRIDFANADDAVELLNAFHDVGWIKA